MKCSRNQSARFLYLCVPFVLAWGLAGVACAENGAKTSETNKPAAKPKTEAKPANTPPDAKTAEKPAVTVPAESKSKADPRLVKALTKAGYKFEEVDQGVLKLYFELQDGRSQQLFVSSQTQKTGALETRKIWATAMKSEDPLTAPVANKLLLDTDKVAFGAWELVKWQDGYRVLFVTSVPADMAPDGLKTAIRMVFSKADAMEKELTKADRF